MGGTVRDTEPFQLLPSPPSEGGALVSELTDGETEKRGIAQGPMVIQGQAGSEHCLPIHRLLIFSNCPTLEKRGARTELDFKIFIYLAVPGLSCGTWDVQSSLQHAGSLVEACGI